MYCNAALLSLLIVAVATPALAQDAKPSATTASATASIVVRAAQRWEQVVRFACLQPNRASAFESQVNQQVIAAGQQGFELVSAAPGRFSGQDCVLLAYRRPFKP